MKKPPDGLIALGFVAYFAVGLVQLIAFLKGLSLALGISTFMAFIIALFAVSIPFVGTAAGAYGAHIAWGWSYTRAILFMIWPTLLFAVPGALALLAAAFLHRTSN
jgi:hypothetical protein